MNRFRNPRSSRTSRLIAWLAVFCVTTQTGPMQALPSGQPQPADVVNDLRASATSNAELYDLDTLLDSNDYEAESIIEFVRDDVAFQPYPGVLRGVQGTLAGRAGNAHDQALTLASMLRDAGFDAQILVATLSESQARELVDQTRSAEFSNLPAGKKSQLLERLAAQARKYGQDTGDLIAQSNAHATSLTRKLAGRLSGQAMLEQAVNASREYRWVRYRDGAADPWTEAHPAHAGAEAWQLKVEHYEQDQISPAHVQNVGLQVWIEDNQRQRNAVTGIWQAPVAALLGKPLKLEIASDAMLREGAWTDAGKMLKDSEFFYVQINGALAEGGKVFDLEGNILSGSVMEGLNSIFSTLNRTGNAAIKALANADMDKEQAQKSNKKLTRAWIEFTLGLPGGQAKKVQRTLFEAGTRDEMEMAAGLIQRWDLDILGTTPMPQYYQARGAELLAAELEGTFRLQRYLAQTSSPSADQIGLRAAQWLQSPALGRLVYLRQMFDQFETPEGLSSYLHEPNIMAIRQGLARFDGSWHRYEMADIVSNGRMAFQLNNQSVVPAPENNVARGVWETRAEMFNPTGAASASHQSAYQALTNSDADKLIAASDGRLNVGAAGVDAWWQVDPTTGSTIGMQRTMAGEGGQAAEFLTMVTLAVSFVFFAIGTTQCVQSTNNVECCMLTNAAIATVGFAIGWAAGAIAIALLSGAGAGAAVGLATGAEAGGAIVGGAASVLADIGATELPVNCG